MITYLTDPTDGVVELTVANGVTREDYDRVIAEMEGAIDKFGKLRLIEIIEEVGAVDSAVWWRDLKWAYAHLNDIARAAVVTDKGWIGPITRAVGALVAAEIRVFPIADLEQARAWVRAG
jgi:hypothetical protein